MNNELSSTRVAVRPRTPLHRSRISRAAIVTCLLTLLSLVLTPGAAKAATPTYATVTACFTSSSNYTGRIVYGPYGGPTRLDVALGGYWYDMGDSFGASALAPSGCVTVAIIPGYQWRMRVNDVRGSLRFVGTTNATPVAVAGRHYQVSAYVATLPYSYYRGKNRGKGRMTAGINDNPSARRTVTDGHNRG